MKRMKLYSIFLLCLMMQLLMAQKKNIPQRQNIPLFSIWVVDSILNKKTDKQIESFLQAANIAKIGALFVESNLGEDSIYMRIIPLAKKYNIQINAWRWTMNNPYFIKTHPEYYQISASGKNSAIDPPYVPYYNWLCPNEPAVRQYLMDEYMALAKIPGMNSVHFDYVRYSDVFLPIGLQPKYHLVQDHIMPDYDFCYCPRCVKGFKEKTGLDIHHLKTKQDSMQWLQYRLDVLVDLVNNIADAVHKQTKTKVTAAVFPTPNMSIEHVRQDWGRYRIDYAMPMLYNGFYLENFAWIGKCVQESLHTMQVKKPIVAGVFMPDIKTKAELLEVINMIMQNGGAGVAMFSFPLDNPEFVSVLQHAYAQYNQ